ncbi:hypothetical protein NKH18_14430 [Streptomyces sp. M10(2022)]
MEAPPRAGQRRPPQRQPRRDSPAEVVPAEAAHTDAVPAGTIPATTKPDPDSRVAIVGWSSHLPGLAGREEVSDWLAGGRPPLDSFGAAYPRRRSTRSGCRPRPSGRWTGAS